jgi:hypothetical protein
MKTSSWFQMPRRRVGHMWCSSNITSNSRPLILVLRGGSSCWSPRNSNYNESERNTVT